MRKSKRKSNPASAVEPLITVVSPCYNEQGNVSPLVSRLSEVLNEIGEPYEIILVDDGSTDGTWEAICTAATANPSVIGLRLSKNFSHQSALLAGLNRAKGQAVITMDSDLQHPPEAIQQLYAAWQDGYDIINTQRQDAEVTSAFKRVTSSLFYRMFSFMSGISIEQGTSDFRLIDRQALTELLTFASNDRFVRGSVQWLGFAEKTIPYQVAERLTGESKYSLKKMLQFAAVAVTSFSTKPLRFGIWLGLGVGGLALLELFYVLFQALSGNAVPGWASMVGVTSFLFAIMFIVVGIIGTYVARIYTLLQNRPAFIIAENTNADAAGELPYSSAARRSRVRNAGGKRPVDTR